MANLSVAQCVTTACLLELAAPKPGNVHRGADFPDLTVTDFMVSATLIGPTLATATQVGVGQAILDSVQAFREFTKTNTHLGSVLLLAPLCAVPREQTLWTGVQDVLNNLTDADSSLVYDAIRCAQPGGLGTSEQMDVNSAAPPRLLEAMQYAADHDLVARQYATGYEQVRKVVDALVSLIDAGECVTDSLVRVHVRTMAQYPDSLIQRKCGEETARQSMMLAKRVADEEDDSEAYFRGLADLDFWLRSDGNRRNPGTTADLVLTGLFAALRDDLIKPPFR